MMLSSFTKLTPRQALEKAHATEGGLTTSEAVARQLKVGRNDLVVNRLRWQRVLIRQFASPFLYLLLFAAALACALGQFIDASLITAFVLINAGLGFVQEYQSEKAVELLRKFVVARVRVRRNGAIEEIDSRDLVPGDLIELATGDHLRADIRLIEAEGLLADESPLTGESDPVEKSAAAMHETIHEPYQAVNIGFAGTSIVSGRGIGVVIAIAGDTQLGEISHLTADSNGTSAFEKGIQRFSSFILWTIVITLLVVFAANVIVKGEGIDIPELLIFSIALAVSVIPEALPIVTTMTLSRGAVRLAHNSVVTKRLSAIEDLGSINVLCTDKTGTLTENHMSVADVHGDRAEVLTFGGLGSPTFGEGKQKPVNSFDLAIWEELPQAQREAIAAAERTHERPFDPNKRWNSVVVQFEHAHTLVVRGAPDETLALCDIRPQARTAFLHWASEQGRRGRRVLAIARRKATGDGDPERGGFELVGGVAYEDPIKSTTISAIRHSRELGVSVKVLTGDSPEVAGAVAHQVGLIDDPTHVITGADWSAMDQSARMIAARDQVVFARVSPREKFEIIQTLEQQGLEVGFLGEGINDAPALKIATVGIVVDGASDIAREAADVILLKHSLEVIVSGIREGREVFANTVKYIQATLASNFGNFLAVATATLLVDFLPMLPIQLLLVNLLSDFPMIAIATDDVDPEELRRPRAYDVMRIVNVAVVFGCVSTVFDFIFFALFVPLGPEGLQTNWFIGSILTELALIFSIRSRRPFWKATSPSWPLASLSIIAAVSTLTIPSIALGAQVFHFNPPSSAQLLTILAVVILYFVVTEIVKLAFYRTVEK